MPSPDASRTIIQAVITQGAAGSLDLVAAPGALMWVYVTELVVTMSAAGTVKFQEGAATDLTGAMAIGANGALVLVADGEQPVLHTKTANTKLNLVSVTGVATGWFRYFVSPEKPE